VIDHRRTLGTSRLPSPRSVSLAAAVAAALGIAATAATARADDAGETLQEIVVTANRREQNLLDVPYNISAVSGQALQAAGITTLSDIARLLPGINIPDLGPRGNGSNSNIIIRGLNANDPGGSAYLPWESVPLVATYVDEVPMFVNLNLNDIQRVEVLRGPQGTLYGSGAVAGTIRIIHNLPDPGKFSAEVSVDASATSHAANGSYGINGLLNVPLTDTAAVRLSAGYKTISGFINADNAIIFGPNAQPVLADPSNPLTSNFATQSLHDIDSALSQYERIAFLWHVTDSFDASFSYDRQDDRSNGFSRETAGLSYVDNVLIPEAPDHRIVDLDALTLTADVGFATVTSSTSFARNQDQSTYDESAFLLNYNAESPLYYGSYPRASTDFLTDYTDSSVVEELRLVSKTGGTWDYTVGGFFRHEWNDLFQYETIPGFAAWSQLPGSADAVNQVLGSSYSSFGQYITQYNGGTAPADLSPVDTNYTYARNSEFLDRAIYGELTLHATAKWQITGGLRVFWQDVSQSLYQTIPYGGPYFSTLPAPANATDALGSTIASGDQKFHNHLFKLNTGYELSETLRAYATYSEGFRHGGANASAIGTCVFCDSPSTGTFKPDTVKNYEIGIKGTAGNWLRFSGDVFLMHWSDIQIQLFDYSDSAYVANGGKATSQGVELELEGQLGHGWFATLGYGYTDAKISSDFTITDRGETILSAQNGDHLPYVPKQTVTAGLSFTQPLSSGVTFDAHADASYRSEVSTQINASASGFQELGGFTTVGASSGLLFGPHLSTRLYVKNLTNQAGISAAGPVLKNANFYPDYRVEYLSRPRTVGLTIAYTFE
jgi:outer membrane receptor protein involved in Fe transport